MKLLYIDKVTEDLPYEEPDPEGRKEELVTALIGALKKIHDGCVDLSFTLLEIQQTMPHLESSQAYLRGIIMNQAIDQAEKFKI